MSNIDSIIGEERISLGSMAGKQKEKQLAASRIEIVAVIVLVGATLVGCGKGPAFQLADVQGTVRYDDGSRIPGDQLRIVFHPQGLVHSQGVAPRAATTYANVEDGSFGELTTWKYGDGVIVGTHKVEVMSLRENQHGAHDPTRAVPSRYQRESTTPLEVEVTAGVNTINLEIERK